ncbi:hypothetical protein CLOP_g806 [Closterium sp. NIES-67]|nr:hypothetical protein CLOP_g806 [Closterium sp. NIES-67]
MHATALPASAINAVAGIALSGSPAAVSSPLARNIRIGNAKPRAVTPANAAAGCGTTAGCVHANYTNKAPSIKARETHAATVPRLLHGGERGSRRVVASAAADGAAASADVTETDVTEADAAAVEAAAWEILDDFNRRDVRGEPQVSLSTPGGVAALKASLLLAAEAALRDESARPLLGICTGSVEEGFTSLRQYLLALGCADPALLGQPEGLLVAWQAKYAKEVVGPAYIKFNSNSKTCQVSPYQTGTFRGVIVQLGRRQVGHLPLSLFAQ